MQTYSVTLMELDFFNKLVSKFTAMILFVLTMYLVLFCIRLLRKR